MSAFKTSELLHLKPFSLFSLSFHDHQVIAHVSVLIVLLFFSFLDYAPGLPPALRDYTTEKLWTSEDQRSIPREHPRHVPTHHQVHGGRTASPQELGALSSTPLLPEPAELMPAYGVLTSLYLSVYFYFKAFKKTR